MPNPTPGDLHINVPLTNISVAYIQNQSNFIADSVFPRVPVQKQSDLYWKYRKSEWRRTDVQKRAPSTETPGVGWNVTTDSYYAHVYGVHKDIDDQLRANADSAFALDRDTTEFITQQMLLSRDKDFVSTYMTDGVWDVAKDGATADFVQWGAGSGTPIENIHEWSNDQRRSTGLTPNVLLLSADVFTTGLRNHSTVLERIKYTQRGVITEDLLASLFDVDRFLVVYATENTGDEYADPQNTDDNATYAYLTNDNALLVYAAPRPSLMAPSGGYTFTWNNYLAGNAQGIRIKRFRMENIASDRIEAEMTYDMKVVSPDCGTYIKDILA